MACSPTDSSTVTHRTMTSLSSLSGDEMWFKEHTSARLTVWVCDGSFFLCQLAWVNGHSMLQYRRDMFPSGSCT